jgi:hypothetical protein
MREYYEKHMGEIFSYGLEPFATVKYSNQLNGYSISSNMLITNAKAFDMLPRHRGRIQLVDIIFVLVLWPVTYSIIKRF